MTDVVFLPGIIAPAQIRYAPLLAHLDGVNAVLKDLSVYDNDTPPVDYSITTEVEGIDLAADRAGLGRFHIYGHSGGGACALAYVAAHPDRVLSLAVDEPASDFSQADRDDPEWARIEEAQRADGPEAVRAFLRLQLAPGVEPPSPPQGPPPPWMSMRPAGIAAFSAAIRRHAVSDDQYRAFTRPVLFTHGSLSNPRWARMSQRLAAVFPDFRSELFGGVHHLNTSHQAQPARVAELLSQLWSKTV